MKHDFEIDYVLRSKAEYNFFVYYFLWAVWHRITCDLSKRIKLVIACTRSNRQVKQNFRKYSVCFFPRPIQLVVKNKSAFTFSLDVALKYKLSTHAIVEKTLARQYWVEQPFWDFYLPDNLQYTLVSLSLVINTRWSSSSLFTHL